MIEKGERTRINAKIEGYYNLKKIEEEEEQSKHKRKTKINVNIPQTFQISP